MLSRAQGVTIAKRKKIGHCNRDILSRDRGEAFVWYQQNQKLVKAQMFVWVLEIHLGPRGHKRTMLPHQILYFRLNKIIKTSIGGHLDKKCPHTHSPILAKNLQGRSI